MDKERRRYFRVEDSVILHWRPIGEQELPDDPQAIEAALADDEREMAERLMTRDPADAELLRGIAEHQPEVASYLERLEQRLANLAHTLLIAGDALPATPTHDVDISASGIGFEADEPLPEGQLIELKLVVFPSYLGILTYGRVVRSEPLEPDQEGRRRFHVGTHFTVIRDADREALIQHILRRQRQNLRERQSD